MRGSTQRLLVIIRTEQSREGAVAYLWSLPSRKRVDSRCTVYSDIIFHGNLQCANLTILACFNVSV